MKSYPSILNATGKNFIEMQNVYVFDKLDGSNLRFEWNRKSGWYKYGTRTRLFDASDPDFGIAISIFNETLSEGLTKIAKDNRWESFVVFAEFWGENSFAGKHDPLDKKHLTLIDAAPYKKGIIGPKHFLQIFSSLPIPTFIGCMNWNKSLIERVKLGEMKGITFEGVVGKVGEGHKLMMRKAKTQAWKDKVLAQYGETEGIKIIES
jgi:hypothetical protein